MSDPLGDRSSNEQPDAANLDPPVNPLMSQGGVPASQPEVVLDDEDLKWMNEIMAKRTEAAAVAGVTGAVIGIAINVKQVRSFTATRKFMQQIKPAREWDPAVAISYDTAARRSTSYLGLANRVVFTTGATAILFSLAGVASSRKLQKGLILADRPRFEKFKAEFLAPMQGIDQVIGVDQVVDPRKLQLPPADQKHRDDLDAGLVLDLHEVTEKKNRGHYYVGGQQKNS